MHPDVLLKKLLDESVEKINEPGFIDDDPIQVPHSFSLPEDIEIAAFLTSSIAWGQRATIIRNARWLVQLMDNKPYDFIMNFTEKDLEIFRHFFHRTFQPTDCMYFMKALQHIYHYFGGLKAIFINEYIKKGDLTYSLSAFRDVFFSLPHEKRAEKHVSDILKNSACKRLNLFLMWMIRKDKGGVHFGLWDEVPASKLYIPLDVHVARVSRELGLLTRHVNDWQAVTELTSVLKLYDSEDPIKYDFALFGTGVNREENEK